MGRILYGESIRQCVARCVAKCVSVCARDVCRVCHPVCKDAYVPVCTPSGLAGTLVFLPRFPFGGVMRSPAVRDSYAPGPAIPPRRLGGTPVPVFPGVLYARFAPHPRQFSCPTIAGT